MSADANLLAYWTPSAAAPSQVLPAPGSGSASPDRIDLLTMAVIVGIAAAGAFSIIVGMAWVLGA